MVHLFYLRVKIDIMTRIKVSTFNLDTLEDISLTFSTGTVVSVGVDIRRLQSSKMIVSIR